MSINGDSDRAYETQESDSDAEPEYVALLRYAADNLCATDALFVEALPDGIYECRECRQPYKRPSRIFTHYATKHFWRLKGIVDLHMLGIQLPNDTGLDDDVMDIDDISAHSTVDPELIKVFWGLLDASTNVVTTRDTLDAPLPDEQVREEIPEPITITEQYRTELTVELDVPNNLNRTNTLLKNPWEPFSTGQEFKLGGWFLDAGVGKIQINRFFNLGLGGTDLNSTDDDPFTSAHLFRKILAEMSASGEHGEALDQWKDGMVNFVEGGKDHPVHFHYRDLETIIESFFIEPWFQKKLVF